MLGDLQQQWQLGDAAIGYMTSSVQLGFICGTLVFAFFTISDRFAPRRVFSVCSLLGAAANLGIFIAPGGLSSLLALRYFTGFFLAGIYPVGMKIAASWYRQGLGQALGYLVGALVMGTAFPHLLKRTSPSFPWQDVIVTIFSIQLANYLLNFIATEYIFLFLIPGPIFGLINLWPLYRKFS